MYNLLSVFERIGRLKKKTVLKRTGSVVTSWTCYVTLTVRTLIPTKFRVLTNVLTVTFADQSILGK